MGHRPVSCDHHGLYVQRPLPIWNGVFIKSQVTQCHSMSLYLSTTPGFQVTSMTSTSTIFCSSTNPFLLKTHQKVPVNSAVLARRSGTAFRHSGGTPRHRRVPCGEVSGHRKQQAGIQGVMAPQWYVCFMGFHWGFHGIFPNVMPMVGLIPIVVIYHQICIHSVAPVRNRVQLVNITTISRTYGR